MIISGGLAGAAGIVLTSTISAGSPTAGTPYLLPAFAAAFLGATQLKHGRFNAGGTLIAVLLLGTGTTGLGLANAPQWSADMFVGIVLIASLAVTGIQRRSPSQAAAASRSCGSAYAPAAISDDTGSSGISDRLTTQQPIHTTHTQEEKV